MSVVLELAAWIGAVFVIGRVRRTGRAFSAAGLSASWVLLLTLRLLRLPAGDDYHVSSTFGAFDIVSYVDSVSTVGWSVGERGGSLNLTVNSEPDTWNYYLSNNNATSRVLLRVFDPLLEQDAYSQEYRPHIATGWEVSDDGLVWTFALRDDVYWSDGERLDASDVVFTFDGVIYNKDIQTPARQICTIEVPNEETGESDKRRIRVELVDDLTVRFHFPVTYRLALDVVGTRPIMPEHVLGRHVDEGSFSQVWDIGTDPREVVTSGPFRIDEYVFGERVTLVPNERYWRTDAVGNRIPYLDRVNYRVVTDLAARANFFKAGITDYLEVPGSEVAELTPLQEDRRFVIRRLGPNTGQAFLAINMNTDINTDTGDPYVPPHKQRWFNNKSFRKALNYALHKPSLIDLSQNSLGYSQWGPMSPSGGFFFNPDVPRYDCDPARARAILDSLDYIDRDGDGIREDDQGVPIEFVIYKPSGSSAIYINVVREDWSGVGLDVHVRDVEWTNLVRRLDTTYEWDVCYLGFTGSTEPHLAKALWVSDSDFRMWHPKPQGENRPWEVRIEEIFRDAVLTVDRDEAKKLYDEWQVIAADELPLIHTTLSERLYAIGTRFENVVPTAYGSTLYDCVFHNLPFIYEKQGSREGAS